MAPRQHPAADVAPEEEADVVAPLRLRVETRPRTASHRQLRLPRALQLQRAEPGPLATLPPQGHHGVAVVEARYCRPLPDLAAHPRAVDSPTGPVTGRSRRASS